MAIIIEWVSPKISKTIFEYLRIMQVKTSKTIFELKSKSAYDTMVLYIGEPCAESENFSDPFTDWIMPSRECWGSAMQIFLFFERKLI